MSHGVRGPTSALTEFLREQGITARGNLSRFARRGDGQSRNTFALDENGVPIEPTLETPEGEQEPTSLPTPTGETTAQKLARIRAGAQARAAKKRKTFEESDEEEDEEDEESIRISRASTSRSMAGKGPTGTPGKLVKIRPPAHMIKANGSLAYCAGCRKRFSVTAYTAYVARGPICHACGNNASEDASASAVASQPKPKRASTVALRRKALMELQADSLPTLQSMCITVLSRNIELVEDLSGIDSKSKDKIAQAISRNRRLNDNTVKLFLAPDVTELRLYDCSEVSAPTLKTLPDFCPRLEKVNLQLCGQIDNEVLDAWGDKLCAQRGTLKQVELYGPFLVRQQAWERFFAQAGTNLESFKIRESARFNLACTTALATHCPNLTQLGLAQIGPLDGPALAPLHTFSQLTYLDISDPGVSAPGVPPRSLQDTDVCALLGQVGQNLRVLNISGNADLTDAVLLADGGIKDCTFLTELNLGQLSKLSSSGLVRFFQNWSLHPPPVPNSRIAPLGPQGAGLRMFNIGRVHAVDDNVLQAVVSHSGSTLTWLSLNSDDLLTADGLRASLTPETVPVLQWLDVSFVREVSDGLVVTLMESDELKRINVFGCNRISIGTRSNKRTKIVGKQREF